MIACGTNLLFSFVEIIGLILIKFGSVSQTKTLRKQRQHTSSDLIETIHFLNLLGLMIEINSFNGFSKCTRSFIINRAHY